MPPPKQKPTAPIFPFDSGRAFSQAADATKSFGMFSCSKATNEMNFLAQKLARQVMGSNNIDSCNRT